MFKTFLSMACLLGVASTALGAVRGAYNHHIAFEGDYVLMERANSYNKHLVAAAGATLILPISMEPSECEKEQGKALIQTRDLVHDMNFDSAFSLAIKIFPTLKSTWEARYLGGLSWRGQKTWSCLENLNLDGVIADQTWDYQFANQAKAIYDSNMYTYQLNYWHHMTPRYTDHFSVSWLAGFRMFNIDEKIKAYFKKEQRTSRYRVRTINDIYGLQLGGSIEYNPFHFLTWGVVIKVGGMFNRDKGKAKMFDNDNTIELQDIDQSNSNFAYMAEIYPFIELRPTKHFFFNVNYRALYVGAIATAERNIILDDSTPDLNHSGHILYHGLTGGVQLNF